MGGSPEEPKAPGFPIKEQRRLRGAERSCLDAPPPLPSRGSRTGHLQAGRGGGARLPGSRLAFVSARAPRSPCKQRPAGSGGGSNRAPGERAGGERCAASPCKGRPTAATAGGCSASWAGSGRSCAAPGGGPAGPNNSSWSSRARPPPPPPPEDDAYLYILLIMIFYGCLAGGLILAYTRSRKLESKQDPYHLYIERDWAAEGRAAAVTPGERSSSGESEPL